MKRSIILGAVVLGLGLCAAPASAALMAEATISASYNGSSYDYSIALTNTSTAGETIGTFWYGWIPGQDYLKTSPTLTTSPAGWSATITHIPNVATNGYAIAWTSGTFASNDPAFRLEAGGMTTFGFRSADAPAEVFGDSLFFDGPPVGTSFVYIGRQFGDPGFQFVVTAVPEPSSLALAAVAGLAAAGAALRRGRG